MKWEKLQLNLTGSIDTSDGRNSPGRGDGVLGPGKRWGHTCNSILGGKYLYVFGGYGKDNCQTNDVHVFDTTKKTWTKPIVKGVPPSPRDSHTCTAVRSSLFVFGGTDGNNPLKDLHVFDTLSKTWTTPSLGGEGPEAREGHSAALVGKKLFIFGGCGKSHYNSEEVYYNDLYILDTETLIWERAVTYGTPPSARDSHSCSSWMNKIIVVGGEDESDYYLSDVHILDTDSLVWKELRTSGEILPPRAGHTTVALGKHLFVFGGFADERNLFDDLHMLNVDTGVWTKVMAEGQGPSSRFSGAGECVDLRRGVLAFFGGCNRHLDAMDDMYYLHTETSMDNGQEKLSMRKDLKRKYPEQYLSFGPPVNGRDLTKTGTFHELFQPVPLLCAGQADKQFTPLYGVNSSQVKIFEAKVLEESTYGYTIETNIDGKHLRGILFSFKPGFTSAANSFLNGSNGSSDPRRPIDVVGGDALPVVRTPTPSLHEEVDHAHAECVQGEDSKQSIKDINAAAYIAKVVDVSQAQTQVPETSGISPAPLSDLKDCTENDSTNSRTEGPCENPIETAVLLPNEVPNSQGQAPMNTVSGE